MKVPEWLRRRWRRAAEARSLPAPVPQWNAFTVYRTGDGPVRICVAGKLTVSNRQQLRRLVDEWLAAGARTFAIDLADCTYADACGLGVLVTISKNVKAARGSFRIENPTPDMRVTLALTKLDALFEIVPRSSAGETET